jgi:hypothetical protein
MSTRASPWSVLNPGRNYEGVLDPDGFELHSAFSDARADVVQHIMRFLTLTDDQLIALERAARLEGL